MSFESIKPTTDPARKQVRLDALAWAEYLYDQYMLKKAEQLHLNNDCLKIDADGEVKSE